jgi:Ran GTPase-activating protein (RanGAP) involved in mRNA processing and transport
MKKIYCPITEPIVASPEIIADLAPLLEHLQGDVAVEVQKVFPKGTIMPDGRLDLCKQNLGVGGCHLVTAALAKDTQIISLLLGTNGIGDTGAAAVAELVKENDRLEIIYLGCNAITATGVAALSAALVDSQTITGLWLKRNPIGVEGARHLATMLATNHSIRTLDLVCTQIGLTGLDEIVSTLIDRNQTIERLYLGGNQIDRLGAASIAKLITHNSHIKALLLNVNQLGDDGVEILAAALSQNTTLQEIGLASNHIGDRGCIALMSAIESHPTLIDVDLGYSPSTKVLGSQANQFGDLAVDSICQMLDRNDTLQKLDLRRTGITLQGKDRLFTALEYNRSLQALLLDNPSDRITTLLNSRFDRRTPSQTSDAALIRSVYR